MQKYTILGHKLCNGDYISLSGKGHCQFYVDDLGVKEVISESELEKWDIHPKEE